MGASEVGFAAERFAAEYLESKKYTILDHNWSRPWGEIDIVAKRDGVLVFVEVKANTARANGFEPELRAGRTKMTKVVRTARTYLVNKNYDENQEWQVDVISVTFDKEREVAVIKHFKNIDT